MNTGTMCELLRAVAARGLVGPVTPILDNARSHRNGGLKGAAKGLRFEWPFLPSCSPNPDPIGRLWGFTGRRGVYGKCRPTFADLRAAVRGVLGGVPTTRADKLASPMTLHFQEFEDVSLLTA